MLEAHIVSPRGSLYYAGDAHPYDLEMLWEHVHDARSELDGGDVHLEILVHDDGVDALVTAWIRRIAASGVQVQMLFTRVPDSPDDGARIAV